MPDAKKNKNIAKIFRGPFQTSKKKKKKNKDPFLAKIMDQPHRKVFKLYFH